MIACFNGCSSLVNVPELPATTLANYCYERMFNGCTSLVNAPALPAITLASRCYNSMFYGCTSLVNAPALPATTLKANCYWGMFYGCTSLVNAPALPATTLGSQCYGGMFLGCTSLVNAPKLPATTLIDSCYSQMFVNCTSLVNAPELPATTLATSCYQSMFSGCTSLVNAPELPATTLVTICYISMFQNCTSLKEIKVHFTEYNDGALRDWVNGVPATGTFYKLTALPEEFGTNRIPEGWTVVNIDASGDSGGDTDKTYVYTASGFPIDEVNGNYWEDGVYDTGITHPITGESITFPLYKNLNNCEMYLNVDDQTFYTIYLDGEFVYVLGNVTGDPGWQDRFWNEVTEARVKPYEA